MVSGRGGCDARSDRRRSASVPHSQRLGKGSTPDRMHAAGLSLVPMPVVIPSARCRLYIKSLGVGDLYLVAGMALRSYSFISTSLGFLRIFFLMSTSPRNSSALEKKCKRLGYLRGTKLRASVTLSGRRKKWSYSSHSFSARPPLQKRCRCIHVVCSLAGADFCPPSWLSHLSSASAPPPNREQAASSPRSQLSLTKSAAPLGISPASLRFV